MILSEIMESKNSKGKGGDIPGPTSKIIKQ
jgi:hypothetical protein